MIVVDASAVGLLFTDPGEEPRATTAANMLRADTAWLAPEHWRTEMLSVIRGLWRGGKLDQADADNAVAALAAMTVATVPVGPHLTRMWQLRSNLSA